MIFYEHDIEMIIAYSDNLSIRKCWKQAFLTFLNIFILWKITNAKRAECLTNCVCYLNYIQQPKC